MEEKNNGKNIIITILSVLLVLLVLYIGYDKLFKNETFITNNTTSDSSLKNNVETKEENQTSVDTTGKIYVKRNGVMNLERVPSDLVGTYTTQCGSYFTINSDGTIYASEATGGGGDTIYDKNNTTFQITYIPNQEKKDEDLILEIYVKSSNEWIFSPFRLGKKGNDGNYSFASFESTPCVNSFEFSYVKK